MCMSTAAAAAAATPHNAAPSALPLLSFVQQYGGSFIAAADAVMVSLEGFMLAMATGAVVFLLILGVLLYYSGLLKRQGKQFIEGGVVIAVFLAFGVPYLMNAYCPSSG